MKVNHHAASSVMQLCLAAGAALLVSCQSSRIELTGRQRQIRADLKAINPAKDPLVRTTPVVDTHMHTFNARYLPLRGILQGKRDAFPPVTWLISDHCAAVIAQELADRTELEPVSGSKGTARRTGRVDAERLRVAGPVCSVFLKLINKAVDKGAWNPKMTMGQQMAAVDEVADQMTPMEKVAVRAAVEMMGMEHEIEHASPRDGLRAAVRFLWTVTQNDARLISLYRKMHESSAPELITVSHMMDLAPVYDQAPEGKALIDFGREQIRRMERFRDRSGPGFHYFVAYNPYRDHWRGGKPGDALRLVQNAVRLHGAAGVKVYPPSGYQAAGNAVKYRPRALLTGKPSEQWDARYAALGGSPAKQSAALDKTLESLLVWCEQENVPVFTHCGYGEFEARKGYGEFHAHPKWWKEYLEKHSTAGRPCRLRLCLGHAGGEDFWFGSGKHAAWGETVYALCTTYPNVYCEITSGNELLDPDRQAIFTDRLAELFGASANKPHPFAKKLVFGTDWYLPDAGPPHEVLRAAQQVFLHPLLRDHYREYFAANAKAYLALRRP